MSEDFVSNVKDKQRIKDQIGEKDTVSVRISKWKTEQLSVYISTCKVQSMDTTLSFKLGDATYGKLGGGLSPQPVLGFYATWNTEIEIPEPVKITDAGVAALINWLNGDTVAGFTYIAYGTGTTAVDTSQTALVSETKRIQTNYVNE